MVYTIRVSLAACLASGCFAPVGNGADTSASSGSDSDSDSDSGSDTDTPTTGEPSQCIWKDLGISGPPARSEHSMVYVSEDDLILLFGGTVDGAELNDLWKFEGGQWHELVTSSPPPQIRSHAAAYDEIRKVMVVFGGATGHQDALMPQGDTYLYDPAMNTWQKASTPVAPTPRYGASMAYYTGTVLLYGGNLDQDTTDREHWSWDGLHWEPLDASNDMRPAKRSRHMVAMDPSGGKLLLYGGCEQGSLCVFDDPTNAYNDTWSWDGKQWKLLSETAGDGLLGAMALHSAEKRLYRFSEHATFLWDGAMWSPPQPTDLISGLDFAVADHSSGLIRFGGNIADQSTWVLDCPP